MTGILALEFGAHDSEIGKMQIRERAAASRNAVRDCLPARFGKIDILRRQFQPGLLQQYIDESVANLRGNIQAAPFNGIQLQRNLCGTDRLTCSLLAPEFEHPAHAQCGFCAISARQVTRARNVLEFHTDRHRRGQAIQLGLIACRAHRGSIGLQYRATLQSAAERLLNRQVLCVERRYGCASRPGKSQGQPL